MATKKTREPRSKAPTRNNTPGDFAAGARRLHRELSWVVDQLNAGQAKGESDADVWRRLKFGEKAPSRPSINPQPGVRVALAAYIERTIHESDCMWRGMHVGGLVLRFANGKITAKEAVEAAARHLKGEQYSDPENLEMQLSTAVAGHSSQREKWRAGYAVLGMNTDITPMPAHRRGLRGDLKGLYEMLIKNPVAADPEALKLAGEQNAKALADAKTKSVPEKL